MSRWPLAVLFLTVLFQAVAFAAEHEPSEAELAKLKAAINNVRVEVSSTRNRRSEVSRELEASEKALLATRGAMVDLDTRIQASQRDLAQLNDRALDLENRRRQQQSLIGDYLLSARIVGEDSALKLMLNQQDPNLGSRMLQYYRYFTRARNDRIKAYRDTLNSISEVSANISSSQDKLRGQQQELQKEQARLEAGGKERQKALEQLDALLKNRGEELARLEQQRTELELLLEEIRSNINNLALGDDDTPFASLKGKLPWPVQGKVVNSFGSKHAAGDLNWEGMTLAAPAGTRVRAIHHGRVVYADWFGDSGLLLIIDHGDGFMSLYAHNQELYKQVGEWVSGGDVIAAAGDTGGQKDAGLYFEIRRNGKAENPVNWCVSRL